MIGTTLIDQSAADSDRVEGFSCLLNASSTENADIQFMLGFCYKKGIGCSSSRDSAKKYYRMASFQNHEKAQWELGYMQFKENDREGWHWICCSHLNGFPIATEFLNDVLKTDPGMKDWIEPLIDNIRKNGINPPEWISKSDSGACYIATAVYGSYNAPEVIKLRKFRDDILQKHFLGRIFVKVYYFLSPPVAEKLKTATCLNKTVKRLLDKFVGKLNI